MIYELCCKWVDKEAHYESKETWTDMSRKELYAHVIEYLDILHKDDVPYEPTIEKVKENFLQFGVIDEDVINNEFNRLMVGWNAWKNFIEKMKIFDDKEIISTSFTINMDANTTIEVMGFEFL